EVHAGVRFDLKTKCTEWHFAAKAGIAVGGAVSVSDDGLGAAAIIKVNGKLHFAARVDGGCILHQIEEKVEKIAAAALEAANDTGDALSSMGKGKVIGVYAQRDRRATVSLRLYNDAKVIRINAQGHVSATTDGASCDKIPLLLIGGPCELAPANGF